MKKHPSHCVLLIFASIVFSVSAGQMGKEKARKQVPKKQVLIAAQKTKFKDAVVAKITNALEEAKCDVKVIKLEKLSEESSKGYSAILVVAARKAGRLNRYANSFFSKATDEERKKTILLTTGARKEKHLVEGVDAITSASKISKADSVADTIIKKLYALLAKQTN